MNSKMQELLNGARASIALPQRPTRGAVNDVHKIPVDAISPDPDNARKHFDADELAALAEDIKRHGQVQNCVVFETDTPGQFQLVAGERRLKACKLAGVPFLMCLVLPRDMARDVRAEIAFAENLCRSELKPVEVAQHWRSLLDRWQCSTRELAARVGVAPSTVSKRLSLLKLDEATQRAVDAGEVHRTKAVQSVSTRRKREKGKGRGPYNVHTFAAGTVKLKRGRTLADLVAEIQSAATRPAEAA